MFSVIIKVNPEKKANQPSYNKTSSTLFETREAAQEHANSVRDTLNKWFSGVPYFDEESFEVYVQEEAAE